MTTEYVSNFQRCFNPQHTSRMRFLASREIVDVTIAAGIGPQWSRLVFKSTQSGLERLNFAHGGKSYIMMAAYVDSADEDDPMLPRLVVLEAEPGASQSDINAKLMSAANAMRSQHFHSANRQAHALGIEPFCTK